MSRTLASIIDCYPFRRTPAGVEFLLLLRAPGRRLAGVWQVVHGKIESGETAVQAAIRELREETGLSPQAMWHLEFVNTFFIADMDAVLMCPGFAVEVAADAAVRLQEESSDYRWLPLEEAKATLLWPGQKKALDEIAREILAPGPTEPYLRVPLSD
jgi:dATP pyrophosphohydrolase